MLKIENVEIKNKDYITADIIAPLFWWKEFDLGWSVHFKPSPIIHENEFTLNDFSHDYLSPWNETVLHNLIVELNTIRNDYLRTKDDSHLLQIIALLPQSYNQKRTVRFNRKTLEAIYNNQKNFKLDEWRILCGWIITLPND